jgi:hypothetical protein
MSSTLYHVIDWSRQGDEYSRPTHTPHLQHSILMIGFSPKLHEKRNGLYSRPYKRESTYLEKKIDQLYETESFPRG